MLSPTAREDLIRRCKYAHQYGYEIASAEEYAKELGYAGEEPPHKVKKFSPAHLLHLAGTNKAPTKKGISPFTSYVPPGVYTRTETKTDTPKAKAKKVEKVEKVETPPPPPPVEPTPTRGEDISDEDIELLIP